MSVPYDISHTILLSGRPWVRIPPGAPATDVDMDIMSASFFVCYSMDCVAWRLVNTRTPCDLASCAVCPLPDHAAVAGQEQRRAILKGVAIRGRLMPGVVIDAVCRSCAGERVLRIMVTSGDGRGCGFRGGGGRGAGDACPAMSSANQTRGKSRLYMPPALTLCIPTAGCRRPAKRGRYPEPGYRPCRAGGFTSAWPTGS